MTDNNTAQCIGSLPPNKAIGVRRLFPRFVFLTYLLSNPVCPAIGQNQPPQTQPDPPIVRYIEKLFFYNSRQADILFIGDSLLAAMPREVSNEIAGGQTLRNFAVPGAQTKDVLWLLRDPRLKSEMPNRVILLIGTNDIFHHHSARETADGVLAVVARVQAIWPQARIMILTMPKFLQPAPTSTERDRANELILRRARRSNDEQVLDISRQLVCTPNDCNNFREDKLHFNSAGYVILRDLILQQLKS